MACKSSNERTRRNQTTSNNLSQTEVSPQLPSLRLLAETYGNQNLHTWKRHLRKREDVGRRERRSRFKGWMESPGK